MATSQKYPAVLISGSPLAFGIMCTCVLGVNTEPGRLTETRGKEFFRVTAGQARRTHLASLVQARCRRVARTELSGSSRLIVIFIAKSGVKDNPSGERSKRRSIVLGLLGESDATFEGNGKRTRTCST